MTTWLTNCVMQKVPVLILNEYSENDIPVEYDLLGEKTYEIMIDGVFIVAAESELTKRGM